PLRTGVSKDRQTGVQDQDRGIQSQEHHPVFLPIVGDPGLDDRHDEPAGNVLSGIRQFRGAGKAPGKEIKTYLLRCSKPVQMPVSTSLCPPRPRLGRGLAVAALPFLLAILLQFPLQAQYEKDWMLGPFERGEHARPIIEKDSLSTFMDPILREMVHWESMATFN